MKCKYCGMYLENVDEESPNGMAHTIKCQTKRIHELENEEEIKRLRVLAEESMNVKNRIQRVALAEEDKGVPVSVCDYCEETYPESWILDGICPYCGHAHNEENEDAIGGKPKETRKLSPSEVVVHIGCLSGTVSSAISEDCFLLAMVNDPQHRACCIDMSMLDTQTRELVEGLLEAQRRGDIK